MGRRRDRAAPPHSSRGHRGGLAVRARPRCPSLCGRWENQFGVIAGLERGDLARVDCANQRLTWLGRDSHAVHQQLGRKLAQQGQWERARLHYERSLEIQPSV